VDAGGQTTELRQYQGNSPTGAYDSTKYTYTAEDEPPSIDEYIDVKVRGVAEVFARPPRLLIEPGRSLVGNAGVTDQKRTPRAGRRP